MATITTTRDGVTTTKDVGESLSEFSTRLRREKEAKRKGEVLEKIGEKTVSIKVTEAPIVARDSSGRGYTATDLLTEQNKALLQAQPKGSYKVTKADGTVVYRTSGVNAQGRYVHDVYKRIQEEKDIKRLIGTYKEIPKSAKKVTTSEGEEFFRTSSKRGGLTYITTYKPGGVKETKVLTKTFIGGSSQFIQKPVDKKFYSLPPTPVIDFALKQKGESQDFTKLKPSKSLGVYAEKLIKREKRLSTLKENIYSKLHIKGKQDAKFYNILEIGKGVARVPFELASIPSFIYGRGQLAVRSVFDPAGRQVLKEGAKKTPSAVREVFVHKDITTGKYSLTAQNIVNIGLTTLSVRSVAKAQSNVGLKVYEKYAKTDIKGTIRGYQGTAVFKSAGKLKGRPYKELTVFKGKASTSTIKTQGKTYIIKRPATGKGTFKIVKTKTVPKLIFKNKIPRLRLEQKTVILKKGKFEVGGKPIKFKTEKGVTTQDIQLLRERGLSSQYLRYLEKLRTKSKAEGKVGKGLKFKAKADIKVKSDLRGIVTHKKVSIDKVDYRTRQTTLIRQFKKPDIKFADKPKIPKDVLIRKQFIKEGQTIVGAKKGYIIQPRHVLRGPKDAFIKGEFTIKGGKGFNVFKNIKAPKLSSPLNIPKNVYNKYQLAKLRRLLKPKTVKEKPTTFKVSTRPKSKETTIDFSNIILDKSKPGEQVALTQQIRSEVYQVPFQTKAPTIQYQPFDFNILQAPLGKVKPIPLIPFTTHTDKTISKTFELLDIKPPKPTPAFKVTTFQEVRPTNIYDAKTVIEQIKQQKSFVDVKVGQRATSLSRQRPKSIIEQIQTQIPISTQTNIQEQIAKQESIFKSVFKQSSITTTFKTPQLHQLAIPKAFGFPKVSLGIPKAQTGFDVFTRTKGVFKRVNIKPLSRQDAINFGAFKVQTTARATFKIAEANGQAQDVFKLRANLKDFYKKDDLFIEKKERRIKSIGELQEITFKGIQARKTKKIFGGL